MHIPSSPPMSSTLFLLTTFTFFTSGCQAEPSWIEPFEPLFNGLEEGTYNSQNFCVTVGQISAKVIQGELDQTLSVFKSAYCEETQMVLEKTISIESQFAGFWHDYVVIDEGTDPNSRDFHLLSMSDGNRNMSFSYTLDPQFNDQNITFLTPTEKDASAKDCPKQESEIREWKQFEFQILIADEFKFDLEKGAAHKTGHKACYPAQ